MEQLELFPEFVTGSAAGAAQESAGRAAAVAATNPPPDGGDALTGRPYENMWRDVAQAAQNGAKIILLESDPWPDFDANDPKYFTEGADGYIEAERLPPEWLALVGKTICADRITVGSIADLLEELPKEVSEEWRQLYAKGDTDEGWKALEAWEEAHHFCWYGEGYYIDDEECATA